MEVEMDTLDSNTIKLTLMVGFSHKKGLVILGAMWTILFL